MNLSPALRFLASHQWAVEGATFERLVALLERHAAGERLDADAMAAAIGRDPAAADAREPVMTIEGDTAVIPMRGILARYADSVNGVCQARGRSAESLQRDLLTASGAGVNRIILAMDSPGGEVTGTAETGDLVRQLVAQGTEVVAFIDGKCASAAYWIASQCSEIVASSQIALVGSIGVSHVLTERQPDAKGDKLHIITSAPAKSSPVLNEAQLANAKAIVMDLAKAFAGAVAAGRGLDDAQAAKVATGEVWTAQAAIGLGLVDRISSLDALIRRTTSPAGTMSVPATLVASAANHPAADPAAANGASSMKITAQALAALVAAFPHHSAHISERALAGDEEGAIRTAVAAKEREATEKVLTDLRGQLATEALAHGATKDALAKIQKEHDALKALAKGSTEDPGGGSPAGSNGKTLPLASFHALSLSDQSDYLARGGKIEE